MNSRDSLLLSLGYDSNELSQNVEDALRQIFLLSLTDQDRAIAIIQDPMVDQWLLDPSFGALLVQANSRRHESISPASVACAMLIHICSNMFAPDTFTPTKVSIITLYWFCGSHVNGPDDSALGLMRSLVSQLLSAGPFAYGFKQTRHFDDQDLGKLLDMFMKLLRQLTKGTTVVCIIDGISFYEGEHLRDDTCKTIRKLAKLTKQDFPILKLLVTSPIRTSHIHRESRIAKHMRVVEIPQHVNGVKQGFNQRAIVMSTEQKVRKLSRGSPLGDDHDMDMD